ncbi:DedA family protein, partial [Acidithiobacillus caldus]
MSRLALSWLPLVRCCAHRQKLVHMVLDIIQFVQSDLADAVRVLSPIVRAYGLPIVFIGIFVESAGMVLAPGETLLIAAGFLASNGTLNPIAVLIVSVVATILGWFIAYFIGSWLGISWSRRHGRWIGVTPNRLQKTHAFLEKYGPIVVLFGRFVVPLRQLQGYISGSAESSFKQFYLWNILGAALWVGFWGGAGYI